MATKKKTTTTNKTKKAAVKKDAESKNISTEEIITPVKKKKKKSAVKKTDLVSINKDTNYRTNKKKTRKKYYTHDGQELTIKEYKFIDKYIETGNISQSVIQAGYESNAPGVYGQELLRKPRIANEVEWRMVNEHAERIATGQEVMEFYSKVMRGEIKDQFELDAPLSERLKAANELAKRTVDIATKAAGVTQGQNEVTIKLDFDRGGL